MADTRKDEFAVSIATGSPGGVYFPVGQSLCRVMTPPDAPTQTPKVAAEATRTEPFPNPKIDCAAVATAGSIANIQDLRIGLHDFAIIQSDWHYHAYRGSSRFVGRRMAQMRSVFSLHPEAVQIIVARDTEISSFDGLAGHAVSVGPRGSGTRGTVETLLGVLGRDASWFARMEGQPLENQGQLICSGELDAAIWMIGAPSPAIAQPITECGARLASFSPEQVAQVMATASYYVATDIPRGTYPGQDSPVQTFGLLATLVTTEVQSETLVYLVVKRAFERLDRLRRLHPALASLDEKRMVDDGQMAPLHPGARRYYAERGWLRLPHSRPETEKNGDRR